jgi:hypothetical protein
MNHDQAAAPPAAATTHIMAGTSPAPPVITALPPAAGNAAVDCSAQIASALAAAGFGADAAATAIPTVTAADAGAGAAPTATAVAAPAGLDFGTCPDASIIFADGLDGRKEKSFEPADKTAFTHGSALNIKVITDFICQQLQTKCGANQAALDACAAGAQAAQAEGGKDQGAADAFNTAIGVVVSVGN